MGSSADPNMCVLLELCCGLRSPDGSYCEVRVWRCGSHAKVSCGWSQLPLFHYSGSQAAAKPYELRVHAGTPFEAAALVAPVTHR